MDFLALDQIQLIDDANGEITNTNSEATNANGETTNATIIENGLRDPNEERIYVNAEDEVTDTLETIELVGINMIIFIIVGGLILLIFVGYTYYKSQKDKRFARYADDPESQIKRQELTKEEQQTLSEWNFNTGKIIKEVYKIPNVKIERKNERSGEYFFVEFEDSPGSQRRTIMSNMPISSKPSDKQKKNCYFEFEIEGNTSGADIVIGIGTEASYNANALPGSTNGSIGFHTKDCSLFVDGKLTTKYQFEVEFGETIGLGYDFETKNIHLFHNGTFLNEPPREFGSPAKKKPETTNRFANQNSINLEPISPVKQGSFASPSASPSKRKDKTPNPITSKFEFKVGDEVYYPMIGVTGPCKILLNIGGATFSAFQQEIAKGLI